MLFVALVNQLLTVFGLNPLPVNDNTVYETVSLIFTSAASVWAWWKNNSFTKNALKADEYLKEMKEKENEFS